MLSNELVVYVSLGMNVFQCIALVFLTSYVIKNRPLDHRL